MTQSDNTSQFIIYQTEEGETRLDVRFQNETVWLTQPLMAELFQISTDNISLHLKNIYGEAELTEQATTEDYSVVRQEGKRQITRKLKHYNLDAIISVGYRVKSRTATRFRQWATRQLREYLVKGFVLDALISRLQDVIERAFDVPPFYFQGRCSVFTERVIKDMV